MMGHMFQNHARIHAWHLIINHCMNFFELLQEKSSTKSNKIMDKERIIKLIITKNHNFDFGTRIKWEEPYY
jgi:hypothetical protein